MNAGIVYYTDNSCSERIMYYCRKQIQRCTGMPIVSVSHIPINFGYNITVDLPRGATSIFRQIYTGLQNIKADIVFLCEHDVLYHPSHFDFMPDDERFYYNQNRWQVCYRTGHALYRKTCCTSLCVAYKASYLKHFDALMKVIEAGNYSRAKHGYAPSTHRIDGVPRIGINYFNSEVPCIDIRHENNFTPNRWKKEQYSTHSRREWTESDTVPGWGKTEGRFYEFLQEVA